MLVEDVSSSEDLPDRQSGSPQRKRMSQAERRTAAKAKAKAGQCFI